MFAKVIGGGIHGIDGSIVEVEVDLSRGLPGFEVVGLPDAAVKESKERVKAALKNQGFNLPVAKIIVNLAPAYMRKEGPSYDLPIAIGILAAQGIIKRNFNSLIILGELSLDGNVKGINGVIPILLQCIKNRNISAVIIPMENSKEASILADSIDVYPVKDLKGALQLIENFNLACPLQKPENVKEDPFITHKNFGDVKGQFAAKKAMEIAAAGGHNIAMVGSPGAGKTMLAQRFPSILPPLTFDEQLEITRIYSAAGKLNPKSPIVTQRPFRSPHHSISLAGLVGGGKTPFPGEISLAHLGVLFLDELLEFKRDALEALRQPLEAGCVTISRANGSYTFPADIQLISSFNPCPCGFLGHKEKVCTCSPGQIHRYISKVSGPIIDRLDMFIEVPPVEFDNLSSQVREETSEDIFKRVIKARELQKERYNKNFFRTNSGLTPELINKYCQITGEGKTLLRNAYKSLGLSARGYHNLLKVARTIADLENADVINTNHISKAISYRSFDRQLWNNY
jgi:magnesium chelatase family protein